MDHGDQWVQMRGDEFAPDLPPNSAKRRENPAMRAGFRHFVLGFPKRRGGIRTPGTACTAYRLRGRRAKTTAHPFNPTTTAEPVF